MSDFTPSEAPFTGRKMLLIIVMFFGTIIAVNATMLTLAVKNFGGLVVENSYVASQNFNSDVAASQAQAIRRWSIETLVDTQGLEVTIHDEDGRAVHGLDLSAVVSRPTHGRETQAVTFVENDPGAYTAKIAIAPGTWKMVLSTGDGQQRTLDFLVRTGGS